MGLLDRFRKKPTPQPATLEEDIAKAADWLVAAMASSGYELDDSIDSFRELDRFFEEQQCPGGLLDGKVGSKLFAIGSYMGQTLMQELGGTWETDDNDPQGEINIAVRLSDGTLCWPVQRAMKRHRNGAEDGLYVYGYALRESQKQ